MLERQSKIEMTTMRKPKLYDYAMSVCSMKTRLAMNEFGLGHDNIQVDIGFALETFEPNYVRLNARCVVPTLVIGEEVAKESENIIAKLAEHSGLGLPEAMWTVLLARIEILGLSRLIADRPNVFAYYQRVKGRPSFVAAGVMPNWKGGIAEFGGLGRTAVN
jgi:glutathione S-transferase